MPRIFVGNAKAAKDRAFLKRIRCSHVCVCIARPQIHFEGELIYHIMPVSDSLDQDMGPHREVALQFVDDAVAQGGTVTPMPTLTSLSSPDPDTGHRC